MGELAVSAICSISVIFTSRYSSFVQNKLEYLRSDIIRKSVENVRSGMRFSTVVVGVAIKGASLPVVFDVIARTRPSLTSFQILTPYPLAFANRRVIRMASVPLDVLHESGAMRQSCATVQSHRVVEGVLVTIHVLPELAVPSFPFQFLVLVVLPVSHLLLPVLIDLLNPRRAEVALLKIHPAPPLKTSLQLDMFAQHFPSPNQAAGNGSPVYSFRTSVG